MTAAVTGPVWIDPPLFWTAVADKSEDEVASLLDHIQELWQRSDVEALLRFDFVTCVGYPYQNQRPSPKPASPLVA